MLQTPVIKADSSAPSAGSKDKDVPTSTSQVDFSAYFSQMVAALPALPQDLTPAPSPTAPAPARTRASVPAPPRAAAAPASAPAAGAAQPAASQASTPTQTQAAPPASSKGSSPASSQVSSQGSPQGSSQGSPQGSSQAQAAPSGGTGPAQAQSVPRATGNPSAPADPRPAPAAIPAPQADLPAPTVAAAADPQADAKAKAALDQAYPGGKFQVQADADPDPPATPQASLTDLIDPVAQATTAPQAAPQAASQDQAAGPQPVPASATLTAAALADLSSAAAWQAPMVAEQTAILGATALPAATVPNPGTVTADNVAATSAASAQAAGAGALPGASGAVRVTAAASPESSLATRQDSLFSQVDGSIRWLLKNQDQGAELQLHPESLGRVQVKLQVEGTVVHAKLWATEASALPVLQQHRASLETSLQAQGLTLGSFDLQHGRREGQTPLPTQDPAATAAVGSALESSGTGQETPTLLTLSASRPGRIEIVA